MCAEDRRVLARLSFRITIPEDDFAAEYEKDLAPILRKLGLVESEEEAPRVVDGYFSRLFAFEKIEQVREKAELLHQDPEWLTAVQSQREIVPFSWESLGLREERHFFLKLFSSSFRPDQVVEVGPGLHKGQWLSLGRADGVPECNFVLMEDRWGSLWFSMNNGMSRFDGVRLNWFDVGNTGCALEDRQGILWFGRNGGLLRCDGATCRLFTPADGLPHWRIEALLEDGDGNLWIGTRDGLNRYDGKRFTTFTSLDGLEHNAIQGLVESRDGDLWVATREGLCRYDGAQFTHFTREDGLEESWIAWLAEAPNGDLWVANAGGACRYRNGRFESMIGLEGPIGLNMDVDQKGQVWLGTTEGVYRYDGETWTRFTTADGMACDHVSQVMVDWRDHVWLTSGWMGRGVTRYDGCNFAPFPLQESDEILPEYYELEDRQGNIWFGTPKGVFRYDGSQVIHLTTADGLPSDRMAPYLEDRHVGETGTGKGLAARLIHGLSARKNGPLIQVNCGGLPDSLVESELFGHERGAFTRAMARKLGKVELAAGGTLFLDEIGDLSAEAQAKLLRLLEHVVQRAVIVCRGSMIEVGDIALGTGGPVWDEKVLTPVEYERWYIERALEACDWQVKGSGGAAAKLGMPASTLQNRMKRLGIKRP